jgi:hypothetical protein
MKDSDHDLWAAVVAAQRELVQRSAEFHQHATDKSAMLSAALRERGWSRLAALHYMSELGDATSDVLPDLIELATDDRTALLARQAILRAHPSRSQLRQHVVGRLDTADGLDFRRFAELLDYLSAGDLLQELVERAGASDDPDTREVAEDFRR